MRQLLRAHTAAINLTNHYLNGWTGGGEQTYMGRTVIPAVGKLQALRVVVAAAPGAGKSYTFTVNKNGSNQSLAVTISGTDTTGVDIAHSVTVAAGDLFYLARSSSGSPTNVMAWWCIEWIDTTNNYSLFLSGLSTSYADGTYCPIAMGAAGTWSNTTESYVQVPVKAGTIKRLYVCMRWSPGGPDPWYGSGWCKYTATLRVNGVSTALTANCTIQGTAVGPVVGYDVTHEIAVNDGDLVDILVNRQTSGYAINAAYFSWGVCYTGQAVEMCASYPGAPGDQTPNWHFLQDDVNNGFKQGTGVEDGVLAISNNDVIKGLTVRLTTAPGGTATRTFTLRKNKASTSLAVTISGAATSGSNAVDVAVADGDTLDLMAEFTGSPAGSYVIWWLYGVAPEGHPRSYGMIAG